MMEELAPFLPEGALPFVVDLFKNESYHLIVTPPRKTKHGDFRPPHQGKVPRITVNGDLNKYAFLVTLIHEVAHLKIWNAHKNRVKPHGTEWKNCYGALLNNFTGKNIFPPDLETAIVAHIKNPKYASCADTELSLALRNFDPETNHTLLQELPVGSTFSFNKRTFIIDKKLRTRYLCTDKNNGLKYRIHGMAEVTPAYSGNLA